MLNYFGSFFPSPGLFRPLLALFSCINPRFIKKYATMLLETKAESPHVYPSRWQLAQKSIKVTFTINNYSDPEKK
ncbi:MAG: hypothetical protein ACK4ZS_03890 [Sulfurimicrobium sp.]